MPNPIKFILKLAGWIVLIIAIIIGVMNLPFIQHKMGEVLSERLSEQMGTEVHVGAVKPGFLVNFGVADVLVKDLNGEEMLKVDEVETDISVTDLLKQKIHVKQVTLQGLRVNLYQADKNSLPNFHFLMKNLGNSKLADKGKFDLNDCRFSIKNGSVNWDVQSEKKSQNSFNFNHVNIPDITMDLQMSEILNMAKKLL